MLFSLKDLEKIALSSKKILLTSQENPSLDTVASILGLAGIIKKLGGKATLLLPEGTPAQLFFLEKPFPVIGKISHARDFVLIFNTQENKITNIRTENNEKECSIRITPEKGSINPKDFSFVPADFAYGWLGILGASSLEKVGQSYFENPDLFFEIPKINIDNQTDNEKYGQINWTSPVASSIGEILADLFLEKQPDLLDQEIAKALLTAIVAGTESFQSPQTSPRSMVLAAQLMKYGVNQTEIIRHLYRNKDLPFLKLWGKTMARLEWEESSLVAHSSISQDDFLISQAEKKDLFLILEEIQKNFSTAKVCAFFYVNKEGEACSEMLFSCQERAEKICAFFQKTPQGKLSLNFGKKELTSVKKEVLRKINSVFE